MATSPNLRNLVEKQPRKPRLPASRPARIDQTIDRAVQGADVQTLLSKLPKEEQALFWARIASFRTTGEIPMEDLWKIDYLRKPPSMEEFITDEYWLGSWCQHSDESEGLFPAWRKILVEDFSLDSRIHNAVFTGALGIGKSVVTVLLLLYRIVLAKSLRNPQSFLGLSRGNALLYVMLSVTRSSVTETVWGDALNFMSLSPYFLEECRFNPAKKYANLRISLGNNILLTAGSKGQHIIGRNTLGVLLDEGNWRLEANPDVKAYALYNEVRVRLRNRFHKISGFLPALSLLASSARDESSTTESVIDEIRQNDDATTERVYRFAFYRIKTATIRLSTRWFRVEYGAKNQDPRILSGWYDAAGKLLPEEHAEAAVEGARIEFVPEDLFKDYHRNPKVALQSFSGISTGGSHRFFSSIAIVEQAILQGKATGLANPCKQGVVPLSDENELQLWDHLDHASFLTRRAGQVVPLRDPDAPRYAHFDLATTSVAGLSICHPVGRLKVEGVYDPKSGKLFDQYRVVVAYDFILAITAGQTKQISLKKLQDFIFWLRDFCGFRFGKITADTFQSSQAIQIFQARGINAAVLSLDRSKVPYYAWRSGFEEGRILLFEQPSLMREIEYLTDLPDKVDHPVKTPYGQGSKDTADSAAGSYFNCVSDDAAPISTVTSADTTLYAAPEVDPKSAPLITMLPPQEVRRPRPGVTA